MGVYPLHTIATVIRGTYLQKKNTAALITQLCTDSRRIVHPESALFFAIETNQRDGHGFLRMAYEKGIRHFVIHRSMDPAPYPEADLILVENTLAALQLLATYHRLQFPELPVIGITGSNGKTIVKEWLYQLLHMQFQIVRSPKSYNSQIGVPFSLWQIESKHTLALIEAGISERGEMDKLATMIQPTIGVLTSLGDAHREGFNSREEKLQEKALLFQKTEVLILPESLLNQLSGTKSNTCITWGESDNSTLQVKKRILQDDSVLLLLSWHKQKFELLVPFTDEASLQNVLTCCCVCLQLGLSAEVLSTRIPQLKPVHLRLELKKGIHQCTILNDSYSADLTSFDIAFHFLSQQRQHQKKSVILSDLVLPREELEESYQQLAQMIGSYGIRKVVAIGTVAPNYLSRFLPAGTEFFCFDNTDSLIRQLHSLSFHQEALLIKGARSFELERLLPYLEERIHETVLEVNLPALSRNLKKIRSLLKPGVKTMAIVKAFGYGSGTYEIANLLEEQGVDYLAVAFADEGVALRKAGISLPIMVMNAEPQTFELITSYALEPELFSFGIFRAFYEHLEKEGCTNYPVHIKIDTGMHRLGFVKEEWGKVADMIQTDLLSVQSVFSHLVASEDPIADVFTKEQAQLFEEACSVLHHSVRSPFLRHLSNSSGILRHPELQYEMVRVGIAMYGITGNNTPVQLEEVLTLRSTVAQLKHIKPGDTVGYNRKGVVTRPSVIAIIRIGYADGFPRHLSNGIGKMLIRGKEAPVIGTVCMDMTMLDVTDIPDVQEGDAVLIFGKERSIHHLAVDAGTIPYEIMTGISERVKRVYIEED
jgi:alanine racemase